jgi:hypothetical protein
MNLRVVWEKQPGEQRQRHDEDKQKRHEHDDAMKSHHVQVVRRGRDICFSHLDAEEGAKFVMVVVIASSVRARSVANRMNFNLQSRRNLDTAPRIGSRKRYISVPPTPIQRRTKPHPMATTARILGFLQVTTVTTEVASTIQTAMAVTKATRPFFTS